MASRKSKVFALSLGRGLNMAVQVVFGMVVARVLSLHDLATYRQTMLAYNFAMPILTLGIPSAMYYFLSGAKERQRGIILDNMALLLFMASIFTAFLLFGGTDLLAKRFNNPDLQHTLRWFVYYPLLTFPSMSLTAVLIINERVNLSVVLNFVLNFALTIALLVSCIVTRGYVWPLYMKIVFAGITTIVMTIAAFSIVRDGLDWPRIGKMWEILKFAAPLGLASLLGSISTQLANVMVSGMCTPEEFAVYSNGAQEIPLVGMITSAIATVILADMASLCKEGRRQEALVLFRKAATASAVFLFPVMCFLLVECRDFIIVMFSRKYIGSVGPFVVLLLLLPVRIVVYQSAYVALGKTSAVMWRTLISLFFTIPFMYVGVRIWGPVGAAIGTVISMYVWTMPYNLIYLSKQFGCSVFSFFAFKELGAIALVSIVSAMGAYLMSLCIQNIQVLLRLVVCSAVFGGIYLFLGLRYVPEIRSIGLMIPVAKGLLKRAN